MTGRNLKKPKQQYQGKLRKPIQMWTEVKAIMKGESSLEAILKCAASDEWWDRAVVERLPLLLDHYGIKHNSITRWYELAIALAFDHVPGFRISNSRGPGRPRRQLSPEDFKEPKRRGRPVERTLESKRGLIELVELFKAWLHEARKTGTLADADERARGPVQQQLRELKGARITDKAAIGAFLRTYANAKGRPLHWVRTRIRFEQKRLSEARKAVQKNRGNSE